MLKKLALAGALTFLTLGGAQAQSENQNATTADSRKPSEILALIEGRNDFARLEEMKWDDDGYYEIVYHTADKARVEINIDAKTGEPVDGR